jgi:hypothetical protein
MWPYYRRLISEAVWRSAGTWLRAAFLAGLALVLLAVALPNAAMQIASPLDRLPRWLALLPVTALVVWDVLNKNYRNMTVLQSEIRALQPVRPAFVFDFDNQFITTSVPGKGDRQAHWYRVRVRNDGTVPARKCMLRLETATETPTGIGSGPLAVTGAGGTTCDIAPDGVAEFDLGYCFEFATPAEFYLSTWPSPQPLEFKGRLEVSVRFTEEQTHPAVVGSYRFAQDSPGSSVWVDCEKGLRSGPSRAARATS